MRPLPCTALLFFLGVLAAAPASALPVFAHRYALTCQACHTTVPHLNAFGQAFQRAGYRLPIGERGAIPVAVKVNVGYSSDAEAELPKVVVDEVELLAGGAISKRFNYFVEQSLGGGFTLSAYHYRGEGFYRQGYGLDRQSGKLDTIAVAQFGDGTRGGFLETHYAFSPALMAVARYDAVAGLPHQRVLSLVVRPARNMRFTLEDQITDHHTLNAAWLLAY